MSELGLFEAVVDHARHHRLVDTIHTIGVSPRLRVTLLPTHEDGNATASRRLYDWGRSIGASDVEHHPDRGIVWLHGTLRHGTPVTVDISVRRRPAEPTSQPLDELEGSWTA